MEKIHQRRFKEVGMERRGLGKGAADIPGNDASRVARAGPCRDTRDRGGLSLEKKENGLRNLQTMGKGEKAARSLLGGQGEGARAG